MAINIQVFSDYVCPFCWLGVGALSEAVAATGAEVIWRAHQLRPEGTPNLDPQGEYLQNAWRHAVYPLAERLGVEMRLPTRQPRTRLAHEAAAWARSQGRFAAYHEALFRAFFGEDRDLGETGVLREIAREVGADAEDLARALAEHRMADEVDEDLLIGRSYGITGVPAFVIGGYILSGVQAAGTLVNAVTQAGRIDAPPGPHLPVSPPIKIDRR